jgi:hypothetical protein
VIAQVIIIVAHENVEHETFEVLAVVVPDHSRMAIASDCTGEIAVGLVRGLHFVARHESESAHKAETLLNAPFARCGAREIFGQRRLNHRHCE